MSGLLGTSAGGIADLNLLLQLAMAAALTVGMFLARAKRFRAHAWTQSTVLLLNLVAIGGVMVPSFRRQVLPHAASAGRDAAATAALIHAGLGTLAEGLGIYVMLVAATDFLPARLRFQNYKRWMRATLALWWVVVAWGVGVYYVWYLQPAPAAPGAAPSAAPAGATIVVKNFSFTPKRLTVPAGTIVEWVHAGGRHQVAADDDSFMSPVLVAGARFRQRFAKPGVYNYYCEFHGAPGGQDMAGTVVVK